MGQKYYYYVSYKFTSHASLDLISYTKTIKYELDGSTETYDPSMPTTNACPYLPGQTVNTLEVPQEHSLSRNRSASMNSLRTTDFKTMDPENKFMTPRPAPPVPSLPDLRIGSSPVPAMSLVHKRSTRSLSPAPSWTGAARRFLRRKRTFNADSDAGSETEVESHYAEELREPRSTTPVGSIRSRDMSPESLRRFLSDDLPETPPVVEQPPKLFIPDEIIEENEDDDNFATSAVSETAPFTMLSPPPFQRSLSSSTSGSGKNDNGSTSTIIPVETTRDDDIVLESTSVPPIMTNFGLDAPRSHFSFSTISSSVVSPTSPQSIGSRDLNQFSFFDDSDDEGEGVFSAEDEPFTVQGGRRPSERSIPKHIHSPITGYSLPQPTSHGEKHMNTGSTSPDLVARLDSGVALGNPNLLGRPGIDAGLDDLVNDMGWMADVIQPKFI